MFTLKINQKLTKTNYLVFLQLGIKVNQKLTRFVLTYFAQFLV